MPQTLFRYLYGSSGCVHRGVSIAMARTLAGMETLQTARHQGGLKSLSMRGFSTPLHLLQHTNPVVIHPRYAGCMKSA